MNTRIRIFVNIIIKTVIYLILQKKFNSSWVTKNSSKEYFRIINLQKIKNKKNNLNNSKKNEEIYPMF